MTQQNAPPAISGLDDNASARVVLYQSGKLVHAPVTGIGVGLTDTFDTISLAEAAKISSKLSAVWVGGASYESTDTEPSHDLKFQSADGRWWEIAEAVPSEAQAGAAADNTTNDATAIGKLIGWAGVDDQRRNIRLNGRVYCATDVADFHDVQWEGPGSIRIGTGPEYFVAPTKQNTGFGDLDFNTIHVDATGDDTNSGLAPEFAVATIQQAIDIIKAKGSPVPGFWKIAVAEGVYAAGNSTIGMESLRGERIIIEGVADDAWDNTDAPDDPVSITAITSASPPVVTATAHGRANGDKVFIGFAKRSGGAHASDGAIYTVANKTTDTFELSGVSGSGWAAYTSGGKVYDLTRSAPRSVIYGAGAAVNGLACDGNISIDPRNLFFIGCGTKAGSDDVAGILATNYAYVTTTNCHYADCRVGAFGRNASQAIFVGGGKYYNCAAGFRAIHTRYTFGNANPGGTSTGDPIVKNCTFGVDVWEGSTGHADGIIFIDNTTDMFARRSNSYIAEQYNRFTNTGSAKIGVLINDGATVAPGQATNTWTGTYKPRYAFKNGGKSLDGTFTLAPGNPGAVFDWKVKRVWPDAMVVTPAGGEITVFTYTLDQTVMSARPQSLRVGYLLTGTWANDSVVARIKLGSVTLYTHTLALDASSREVKAVLEGIQNNFDSLRGDISGWDKAGTVVSPIGDYFTVAFDTQSAAQNLVLTIECVSASDTVTVQKAWLEGMGW